MNLKLNYYLLLFILGFSLISKAQNDKLNISQNLFANQPDSIPKIFAPEIVSVDGRYEYGVSFTPDLKEIINRNIFRCSNES